MKVHIIRSQKRRKTVQAREVDGVLEIRAPASMPNTELEPIIDRLRKRIERRKKKRELDDDALARRANKLNRSYFDGNLQWKSMRWVTNQNKRFASCTPSQGTIRVSHRLATMPDFVLDYVIVHELAHLIEANHGDGFWALVARYPKTERARGYLMAVGLEDEIEES